jgi:hypothetical protein
MQKEDQNKQLANQRLPSLCREGPVQYIVRFHLPPPLRTRTKHPIAPSWRYRLYAPGVQEHCLIGTVTLMVTRGTLSTLGAVVR